MSKDRVELKDIEKDILNRGISVGNEVLYTLCKDYPLLKENNSKEMNKERRLQGLAAELWLIGRSYAASPERRNYGVKIEWTNSGNGLDTYFDLLAEKLSDNYYEELNKIVVLLNKKKYQFPEGDDETDKDVLVDVITAVLNFNRLLKKVRFDIDLGEDLTKIKGTLKMNIAKLDNRNKKDDVKRIEKLNDLMNKTENERLDFLRKNQGNMLSFSSKFLHFHFPEVVFIMDSITKQHLKTSFSFTDKGEEVVSNIKITKYDKNTVKDYLTADKFSNIKNNLIDDESLKEDEQPISDKEYDYIKHCVNEYILAKEINNANPEIFNKKYIPRLIDTYVLIANSDFSVNQDLFD